MISDARRGHVSPGIYTEERDVTYSVNSLGITSLGLVGETLYGPAFENIEIETWTDFVDYFGGTSTEKYKENGRPKYELPYVAKSYLEESKRLNVVRVLGLSGYHAGPAWVIYSNLGDQSNNKRPLIVLRSKMSYKTSEGDFCKPVDDTPSPIVEEVKLCPYNSKVWSALCEEVTGKTDSFDILNSGKFSLEVTVSDNAVSILGYKKKYVYNVSLNRSDSDYIYKVIGSDPEKSESPVYIEAVYENSFEESKVTSCGAITQMSMTTAVTGNNYYKIDIEKNQRTKAVVSEEIGFYPTGQTFGEGITTIDGTAQTYSIGEVITINENAITGITSNKEIFYLKGTEFTANTFTDIDDYREMYRPGQTPWFVSECYASVDGEGTGETTTCSMRKLFKFVTISDGDAANYQIKVSIEKVNPKNGTFDVVVRDFNDTDDNIVVLEKFSKCTLNRGDSSYLPFKVGSIDGGFAAKSKYITVEMASDDDFSGSVPCGFLGYPIPKYGSSEGVLIDYNIEYNPTLKERKQYFGLTNDTIDIDILGYKGKDAYDRNGDVDPTRLANGFHLDSIISHSDSANTFIDGVNGYVFTTVSTNKITSDLFEPRIIDALYMSRTIYKDENLRKFTAYFYGGFDGWDVNRGFRTNGDEYKATMYSSNGSDIFSSIDYNGLNMILNLPSTAITSDYYAYLGGYRVFANPQDIDINVFATPGIDWYNNNLLTKDVIEMIEDADDGRGGDALYIMNSPADLDINELTTEFDESDINTSYACTYFPWVMYFDSPNKMYINLPPTRDVLRNIAKTDNNAYPWYTPAGFERGSVNCIKADIKTTLAQEDDLYEHRINPVKTFAKDGVKIWGNKTAYDVDSPLNRINVRRLMIRVKKLVSSVAKNLIFEQYTETLDKQFKSMVEPILAEVKSNRGIFDYRVKTECTPETRDQHILPARILIKPTPALEYISISFVVYPESVDFQE